MTSNTERRDFLKLGAASLAVAGLAGGAAMTLSASEAAAQSASDSLLREVLNRGKLLCGTGSTNAPWHFENDAGELVGMDITMGRILAKALFDDADAVEFVLQDPAQRIPNVTTGKVDIAIQFRFEPVVHDGIFDCACQRRLDRCAGHFSLFAGADHPDGGFIHAMLRHGSGGDGSENNRCEKRFHKVASDVVICWPSNGTSRFTVPNFLNGVDS